MHVDAAAVHEPRIEHGAGLVDPSPDRGGDPLGHMQDVGIVAEVDVGQLKLAAPLHIDHVGAVDQDVRHRVVAQQRFEWAEPDHVIDDFVGQALLLLPVEQQFQLGSDLGYEHTDAL